LLQRKDITTVLVLNSGLDQKEIVPLQIQDPQILELLQDYEVIFQEPQHLPPKRSVDHAITLVDSSKTVNQRPYRLPHHQKNAMEELIKHMLDSHMIRPSISPYLSPVILVKKKDGF
jgi:ABC-type nitrate/sulfonate/bicarbonate transport system ATPase subunit